MITINNLRKKKIECVLCYKIYNIYIIINYYCKNSIGKPKYKD